MNTEQEREDFEAWFISTGRSKPAIWSSGEYVSDDAKLAFKSWQARAAMQSQDAEDAERLDWLLRHLPGDAIRYCVGVIADTADIDEFRAAIDHARRVEEQS